MYIAIRISHTDSKGVILANDSIFDSFIFVVEMLKSIKYNICVIQMTNTS